MKAAIFYEFGDPSVLRYEDVATPEPKAGNVVIKVLAAGINRLEVFLREGVVTRDLALPHILGSDAAGEIAAIGADVSGFVVGERVVPMPGYPLQAEHADFVPMSAAPSYAIGGIVKWGTYAQFIEVPARWVLKDTTRLSAAEMATLPMVTVTGVRAVKTVGGVKSGDHVLIHAGASGTGSFSVQFAKALGAKVATTVDSDEKAALASRLGADLVIDVRAKDFVQEVRNWTNGQGVDVTVDNLGGAILQRSMDATRVCGTIVTMGFVTGNEATFKVREFFFAHKTLRGTLMGDRADFQLGMDLIAEGKIKPVLDKAFALADAPLAHDAVGRNKVLGNVVLLPWA